MFRIHQLAKFVFWVTWITRPHIRWVYIHLKIKTRDATPICQYLISSRSWQLSVENAINRRLDSCRFLQWGKCVQKPALMAWETVVNDFFMEEVLLSKISIDAWISQNIYSVRSCNSLRNIVIQNLWYHILHFF